MGEEPLMLEQVTGLGVQLPGRCNSLSSARSVTGECDSGHLEVLTGLFPEMQAP